MGSPMVYSVMAKLFGDASEEEYAAITEPCAWRDFLDEASRECAPCPLFDFLATREIAALENPPSFERHQSFCRRHFTGGMPQQSAMPVESLYRGEDGASHGKGSYRGASALYMEELIARMGLALPARYRSYPDHLAMELDLLAVLLRSGCSREASAFLAERFDWLPDYRMRLLGLNDPEACFYIALIDVAIDRHLASRTERETTPGASSARLAGGPQSVF